MTITAKYSGTCIKCGQPINPGDDWSRNNVRTGGAGAVGHRIPFNQALADELRAAEALLMPGAAEKRTNAKSEPEPKTPDLPSWTNEDRSARIVNLDRTKFGHIAFVNTSHPRNYNPEMVRILDVEYDRFIVHNYTHTDLGWQLWDDDKCTIGFRVAPPIDEGRRDMSLDLPITYPDDVSMIIGIGLKTGLAKDPQKKAWLLSMREIGGETTLAYVLKQEMATFDDGHTERVLIEDLAIVPVDGRPSVEVVFETTGRNAAARVVRNTVRFDDGHTEDVYVSAHDWWYMSEDGDAGTEYSISTDGKSAIQVARQWVRGK